MKVFLRSIQFLLIFFLIVFTDIIPASSTIESNLPSPYDCYRTYETIISRLDELTIIYPDLAHLKTIGQSMRNVPSRCSSLAEKSKLTVNPGWCLSADYKQTRWLRWNST